MSFNKNIKPTPLICSKINNTPNQFANVLLIDRQVFSHQLFVDSVNSNTFPIVYSTMSSKKDMLTLLQTNFTNINRIGIVFTSSLEKPKTFLDCKSLFNPENQEFIIDIIKEFQVKNIDFLACNTLNYPNWVNYYTILSQNTNVIVGASNNNTGNIKYGGDFIMENTNQDVEFVYFTKSIEYYTYLLDNPILLENYRVDYSNSVYVLLTIDINNFTNVMFEPPPDWLKSFELYYNETLQYTLTDLDSIVFTSNTSYPFDYPSIIDPYSGIAFWTTDDNINANFFNLMSISSLELDNIGVSNISVYTTISENLVAFMDMPNFIYNNIQNDITITSSLISSQPKILYKSNNNISITRV